MLLLFNPAAIDRMGARNTGKILVIEGVLNVPKVAASSIRSSTDPRGLHFTVREQNDRYVSEGESQTVLVVFQSAGLASLN